MQTILLPDFQSLRHPQDQEWHHHDAWKIWWVHQSLVKHIATLWSRLWEVHPEGCGAVWTGLGTLVVWLMGCLMDTQWSIWNWIFRPHFIIQWCFPQRKLHQHPMHLWGSTRASTVSKVLFKVVTKWPKNVSSDRFCIFGQISYRRKLHRLNLWHYWGCVVWDLPSRTVVL